MKHKTIKFIGLIIVLILIYSIYNLTTKGNTIINYVALGDSLAEGMNSYGEIGYGYPDYIKDYLAGIKRLGTYTKSFANSGQETSDLLKDLYNNKDIIENNKTLNLRRVLRESHLVTITIGANDFTKGHDITSIIEQFSDVKKAKKDIKEIGEEIEKLIIEIKKYAKKDIILIGYYNPFPEREYIESKINEVIEYADEEYQQICDRQNIIYISISDIFDNEPKYLSNPNNVHPNVFGYEAISKLVIGKIENIIK